MIHSTLYGTVVYTIQNYVLIVQTRTHRISPSQSGTRINSSMWRTNKIIVQDQNKLRTFRPIPRGLLCPLFVHTMISKAATRSIMVVCSSLSPRTVYNINRINSFGILPWHDSITKLQTIVAHFGSQLVAFIKL